MRRRLLRGFVPSVVPLVLILLASPGSLVAAAPPAGPAAGSQPAKAHYSPAKSCSACHKLIYTNWSEGPHARSATSPAFLESVSRAVASSGNPGETRSGCVWCHAPTTLVTGDFELQQAISREGITCDFCHTVAEVDLDKAGNPFVLEPGAVKRGPLEYARSPGHKTMYSPLHKASPLLCASCHEFKNSHGVAVLSTYTEWKEGPYPARGVPCQECHMALVPGSTTAQSAKAPVLRVVNLHRVVGGSAQSQLNRGLDLRIDSVARSSGSAEVSVVVKNVAAGHSVPGGLATKSLVLVVGSEVTEGKIEHPQERVYRREMKDDKGVVLETVADMFLRSASVGADTRIKPLESRTERFTIPLPSGSRAIVARLEYRDASDPRSAPTTLKVTEVRRDLTAR